MFGVIRALLRRLGAAFQPCSQLLLENLALQHQLLVVNRNAGKPRFRNPDWLLTHFQRHGAWFRNSSERLDQPHHLFQRNFFRFNLFVRAADQFVVLRHHMFEATAAGVGHAHRLLTASLTRELGILLSLSVIFPFLIHILPVPEDARLGPRLLPMFYAPLLAALLGRTRSALIVALAAPWLNWALTTHPAPRGAFVAMIQLLVFVFAVRVLLANVGARWFLAAPAYFSSIAVSVLAVAIFPGLIGGRAPLEWAAQSVAIGLPGIAILVLINWMAVWCYPSGSGGGGQRAA